MSIDATQSELRRIQFYIAWLQFLTIVCAIGIALNFSLGLILPLPDFTFIGLIFLYWLLEFCLILPLRLDSQPVVVCRRWDRINWKVIGFLSANWIAIGSFLPIPQVLIIIIPILFPAILIVFVRWLAPVQFCLSEQEMIVFDWKQTRIRKDQISSWNLDQEVLCVKFRNRYLDFSLNQAARQQFVAWIGFKESEISGLS